MNVPDEFAPYMFAAEFVVPEGIPIVLESPILNASPLAKKELTNTLISFDFKEGCDVHQVEGEVGEFIRTFILQEIRARFKTVLCEEVSRNLALASLLPEKLRIGGHICRISHAGIHNGQVYIWILGAILPLYTIVSVMSTIFELLESDPIFVSLLDTAQYEVMFCGSGFNFF